MRIARFMMAALAAIPMVSYACGLEYGSEVPEANAIHYMGFVKDEKGKPVADAMILVTVGKEFVSDKRGKFTGTLGFDSDNGGIVFVCKRSGFRNALAVKRPSTANAMAIFVICTMKPE